MKLIIILYAKELRELCDAIKADAQTSADIETRELDAVMEYAINNHKEKLFEIFSTRNSIDLAKAIFLREDVIETGNTNKLDELFALYESKFKLYDELSKIYQTYDLEKSKLYSEKAKEMTTLAENPMALPKNVIIFS